MPNLHLLLRHHGAQHVHTAHTHLLCRCKTRPSLASGVHLTKGKHLTADAADAPLAGQIRHFRLRLSRPKVGQQAPQPPPLGFRHCYFHLPVGGGSDGRYPRSRSSNRAARMLFVSKHDSVRVTTMRGSRGRGWRDAHRKRAGQAPPMPPPPPPPQG